MRRIFCLLPSALFCLLASQVLAGPAYTDPKNADEDFPFVGEYVTAAGADAEFGAQVVALGKGKFDVVVYSGGLPGDGWKRGDERAKLSGAREGDTVTLKGSEQSGKISGDTLTLADASGKQVAELTKTVRKSPTLGAKPPKGAMVLFDGTTAENFKGGKMTDDGLLMEGSTSNQLHGDAHVHLEFATPYQPEDRGQGRGNSGVYLQGRYEVQVLDSFGLEGENNEAGGIYSVHKPAVNMAFPPLTWQTYDIDYTAPKFENGKKVSNAKLTVRHNGVVIHEEAEVKGPTRAAPFKEVPEKGPLYLQNHGNPVRYRNIWIVEK